jgi:hypothetical protein
VGREQEERKKEGKKGKEKAVSDHKGLHYVV